MADKTGITGCHRPSLPAQRQGGRESVLSHPTTASPVDLPNQIPIRGLRKVSSSPNIVHPHGSETNDGFTIDLELAKLDTSADDTIITNAMQSPPRIDVSTSKRRKLWDEVLDARDLQRWNKQYNEISMSAGGKPTRISSSVVRCHQCQTDDTPQWRRGPDGYGTLCNVCGLLFARSKKKRLKMQAG